MQELTHEQIISLCQTQPAWVAEKFLALVAQVTELQARLQALDDQLAKDSHNSHQPPSRDRVPRPRPKSLRQASGKKAGGQIGHAGTTLQPVEKPDHVIVHKVERCRNCQRSLKAIAVQDYDKRQVFDVPPLRFEVTEHQGEIKACPHCLQNNHATFPEDVTHAAQYGERVKALSTYLNTYQLVPCERTAEFFQDVFSQNVSTGSVVNFNRECSTALADYEQAVKAKITAAPQANFDETGTKINGRLHWLHVAATPELTYYACHEKRGQEAMDAIGILSDFQGTAIHDHLAAYRHYTCRHALCNGHHLRELIFVEEQYQQRWAKQCGDLLLDIKTQAERNQVRFNAKTLHGFRQKFRRLVKKGFEENPLPVMVEMSKKRGRRKKSKSRNLVERFAAFEDEILAFAEDFNIPFDNNQAERDLRMMKLQQKISGCFRSRTGAEIFCRIRGYISTNKKQSFNILAALQNAFHGQALSGLAL
jgi:transposase